MPPSSAVACNPAGGVITHPASTQLAVDCRTTLPVLELQRPQAMTHPFVDIRKDSRCLGNLEVGLPSCQVLPQFLAHGRHALTDNTSGQHADALFYALPGLGCDAQLDLPPWSDPEM